MRVEFYFDFSCPYAYLGSTQIESLAHRRGAELVWKPMLLGGVFRAVAQSDFPAADMPAAKARHNGLDMLRWADLFGVPLRIPAAHPMKTVRALRALLALPASAWPTYIHAVYRAYWNDGADIRTPAIVESCLRQTSATEEEISSALAANDDDDIKAELRRRTDEAIERGVFGAPTMFVGDAAASALMFWGQDRLHMVEKALEGWNPAAGRPTPEAP